MRIMTSRSRDVTNIKALIFGDSGIGKTTMLRTLPEDKTLIVTAERSLLPLRNDNYGVVELDGWNDVIDLAAALADEARVDKLKQSLSDSAITQVRYVAIDSLSALSYMCKKSILEVDRRVLTRERTGGKRDSPEKTYGDQMDMEAWGLYRTRMSAIINSFVHLPYHIIFTCVSQWTEDKTSGAIMRTPGLNGKLAMECPEWFDLVLHMEDTKDEEGKPARVVRTLHSDNILAKDASGVLEQFEPVDWSHIFSKILKTNGTTKKKGGAK